MSLCNNDDKILCVSRSVVSNSLQSHGLQPTKLLCPWNSPGKNIGVACHSLFQIIFLTQILNLSLLYLLNWQVDSLLTMPPGKHFNVQSQKIVFGLIMPVFFPASFQWYLGMNFEIWWQIHSEFHFIPGGPGIFYLFSLQKLLLCVYVSE